MNRLLALSLALDLLMVAGCATPMQAHDPSTSALPATAPPAAGQADFVFVYLKTGPRSAEKTPEERQSIFDGHMANIRRLADERKLMIAGPFGAGAHDKDLRGIFVFDVPTVEEARALTETDPGVQSGVFVLEAHPLRASAALRQAYELNHADEEAAAREGKPTGPGDNIRGYVMLTAHDAAKAGTALSDLAAQCKVIWSGRFGGDWAGQGVYVLDAADVAAAQQALGPALARLGDCTLDSWWSTKALARLPTASSAPRGASDR